MRVIMPAIINQAGQKFNADKLDGINRKDRVARYDLARQFRIMVGTSPYRYLVMRRLEFARELIHRERPLVEVALDTGFADQAHLTRAFRSAFGLTPALYPALMVSQRRR